MPSDLVRLIARVPPDLHAAIKGEAARSRRSLQSIVVEALSEWLRIHPGGPEFVPVPLEAPDAGD